MIGVNPEGDEREIRRLPGSWIAYDISNGNDRRYLAPMGAVSTTGLLAMPSHRGEADFGMMHWEIVDLHRAQADPVVVPGIRQFVEQVHPPSWKSWVDIRGGFFWGPAERLAVAWYDCSLQVTSCPVDIQLSFIEGRTGAATTVDTPDLMRFVPAWAHDGSGVVVATVGAPGLLRPDGTVDQGAVLDAAVPCETRFESGTEITLSTGLVELRDSDGNRDVLLPPARNVGYACLAPDESTIVHNIVDDSISASRRKEGIFALGSGAWFEIEGSFAGWLEVAP